MNPPTKWQSARARVRAQWRPLREKASSHLRRTNAGLKANLKVTQVRMEKELETARIVQDSYFPEPKTHGRLKIEGY